MLVGLLFVRIFLAQKKKEVQRTSLVTSKLMR